MKALRPFTLFCCLLAGLFLSGLAQAQTYYTDRTTFETDNPGLNTEDFESGTIATPPICLFDGPVNSSGDGTCFGPGDLLPGVNYNASNATSPNMALVEGGFGGFTTQSLASNNPGGSTILTFTAPSITLSSWPSTSILFRPTFLNP